MAETEYQETLTTAEAAKLLGVRADTVHVLKAEGRLAVVGKGAHSTNLFARADVERLRVQRLQAKQATPTQAKLPAEDELACEGCRALRVQVLAERQGRQEAEDRLRAEKGRAERAMAALHAAVG